jgi:hypothetical protein
MPLGPGNQHQLTSVDEILEGRRDGGNDEIGEMSSRDAARRLR